MKFSNLFKPYTQESEILCGIANALCLMVFWLIVTIIVSIIASLVYGALR